MKSNQQEIQEALQAADDALFHLDAAKECLRKAKNWGIADLLGGGMIATFIKHSKMGSAEQELNAARDALQHFAKELADIDEVFDFSIQADDFLHFADYFFDGVVADWMMQSRIAEATRQVEHAIAQVSQLKLRLQSLQNTPEAKPHP